MTTTDLKEPASDAEEESAHAAGPSRFLAAIAGALGGAFALAIGELIDGASKSIPSLVTSAGDWVIDVSPGQVERNAIDALGTNDKPALLIGTVIITILIGAATGRASVRDSRVAPTVFTVFALLGWWFLARNPLNTSSASWLVAAISALGGFAVFRLLFSVARTAEPKRLNPASGGMVDIVDIVDTPTNPAATRRSFFGWAGGVGLATAGLVGWGRKLRNSKLVDAARDEVVVDTGSELVDALADIDTLDEIPGIASYVTDSTGSNFYRIDTALSIPQVDPSKWTLKITGMVDNPVEFTLADIQAMDLEDRAVTIACVSNEVGGGLVGNALWTGIPISTLLEIAGVQQGATQIVARSVDDFTTGFPTELASDGRTAMLAIGMNGEALPVRHGFPARLVVAGIYGYVSATKWIEEINLTRWEDFDGYWIPRGWSKEGPVKTQSRIDVPRLGSTIASGPQPIAGVAWAPTRGIAKVEVQVGDQDWQEATLGDSLNDETWVQWMLEWDAPLGDHLIRVRATDGDGILQSEQPTRVDPNGAAGWHRTVVRVT
ncbi:MAG: molybdopterin-dependent oxidoreductase [Acidimicrobiales bacterium]